MSPFRGFGFITFSDPASVDKVLAHGSHELDGKKVCQKKPNQAHFKSSIGFPADHLTIKFASPFASEFWFVQVMVLAHT